MEGELSGRRNERGCLDFYTVTAMTGVGSVASRANCELYVDQHISSAIVTTKAVNDRCLLCP